MSINISILKLAEATLGACALALVFAALAFLAGCVKGSKGMSMGVASGLAVLTYLLNTLGGLVNWPEELPFPFAVLSLHGTGYIE